MGADSARAIRSDPEAHPNFIDLFSQAPVNDSNGEVAGAGEDGQEDLKAPQQQGSCPKLIEPAI